MKNIKFSEIISKFLDINIPESKGKNEGDTSHGIAWEKTLMSIFDTYKVSYVYQPNGAQKPPEFTVTHKGKSLDIDQKLSKTGKPMWNSTLPKEKSLYLIGSTNDNRCGVWFGNTLLPAKERERLESFHKAMLTLVSAYNTGVGEKNYYYGQRGRYDTRFNPVNAKVNLFDEINNSIGEIDDYFEER